MEQHNIGSQYKLSKCSSTTRSMLEQHNQGYQPLLQRKKKLQNPCECFPIEASSASFVRLRATLSFPLLSLLIHQLLDQVSYARRQRQDVGREVASSLLVWVDTWTSSSEAACPTVSRLAGPAKYVRRTPANDAK